MKFSKPIRILIFVALSAGILFWLLKGNGTQKSSGLGARATVIKQDLVQRVTISGSLFPRHRLDVKPSFAGFVQNLYVKVGDLVKAGEPLVMFSPSMGRSESNYPVRASFAGQVTQILKNEGEYVRDSSDQNLVLRVDDLGELIVQANVAELDIAKIKKDQKTKIRFSSLAGENFSGVIREISLSARDKDRWSSASTEFQVSILVESHDPRLLPGMTALVDVITNKREQVLTLAHEYIQEDANGAYFVTTEKGDRVKVELGLQTDEAVEIKAGLKEGDKVQIIDFLNLPKLQD